MKKKIMFSLMALCLVTIVSAGYLVSSFVLTTDVYEPFEVQYAIIGDAGNYEGGICSEVTEWTSMDGEATIDVGGLYAGESRKICTKITNLGEGDITYAFTADVEGDITTDKVRKCVAAFGSVEETGTALGTETTFDGAVINVAGDAIPVDDCRITIAVSRG